MKIQIQKPPVHRVGETFIAGQLNFGTPRGTGDTEEEATESYRLNAQEMTRKLLGPDVQVVFAKKVAVDETV